MIKAPKGKPNRIGTVKASESYIALGRARNKFPGYNVSVKLHAMGLGREMSTYSVFSKHRLTSVPRR